MENSESEKNTELQEIKKKKEKVELSKKDHIVFNIVAIICIVIFSIAISPKTLQNDTFYTIKIGEYIYNNGIANFTEDI